MIQAGWPSQWNQTGESGVAPRAVRRNAAEATFGGFHPAACNSSELNPNMLDKISKLRILSKMAENKQLGPFLRAARERCSLTLRAVERASGVSNAYLSQLESGKIRQPSPVILHKLAGLYEVSYAVMLEQAGYPAPR